MKWTQTEKDTLPARYSCQLILENATDEQLQDKSHPSDAMIVTYEFGGITSTDLVRGKRGDIFNLYYDSFGKDVVKLIDFGYGTVNPILWGYQSKEKKKKK